jgi:hypothetical protein
MLSDDHPDTTGMTPRAIRAMIEEQEAARRALRRAGTHRSRCEDYEALGRAIDVLRARLGELTRGREG